MAKTIFDLTDEDIRRVVTDMFSCKKVTCIKRSKKWDEISCKIYTEWETTDDDGNEVVEVLADDLELKNPFDYGESAIHVQMGLNSEDYTKWKQMCYARGIRGASIKWIEDNPYTNKED